MKNNTDLASGEFTGRTADTATTNDIRQYRMKRSTRRSKLVLGVPRLGESTLQNSSKYEQPELWDATAVRHFLKYWSGLGSEIEEVVSKVFLSFIDAMS